MKRFATLLTCILMTTTAPALAQSHEVTTINGWTITDHRGYCSAATAYGSTLVDVTYWVGPNRAMLILSNGAWESIQDQRQYPITVSFRNGSTYNGAQALGSRAEDGFRALSATFSGEEFLIDMASANGMEVSTGTDLLGRFSLAGSRAAMTRLAACSQEGFRRYPPDPFTNVEGRPAGEAVPNLPPSSLISDADYPASAIRANEQGAVGFRLAIGPDGRVSGCTVTQSSNSAALDGATCRIMRMRARFQPGSGTYFVGRINWQLSGVLPEAGPRARPGVSSDVQSLIRRPESPAGSPERGD